MRIEIQGPDGEWTAVGGLASGPITPVRPRVDDLTDDALDALHARLETAEKGVAGVRALHFPTSDWSWRTFGCRHDQEHDQKCGHCGHCWPCATVRAAMTPEQYRP